eukprot:g21941.t1
MKYVLCPQVAVENLLKTKLLMVVSADGGSVPSSPAGSPVREPHTEFGFGITSHLLQTGTGPSYELAHPAPGLAQMYSELYSFFGDSLATRFGTGSRIPASAFPSAGKEPVGQAAAAGTDPKTQRAGLNGTDQGRKMPQLTMSLADSPVQGSSPGPDQPSLQRASLTSRTKSTAQLPTDQGLLHQRGTLGLRDVFQRAPVCPQAGPSAFLIAGRQMGRRGKGRLFQTSFPLYHKASLASKYSQRLPMIGRVNKPIR